MSLKLGANVDFNKVIKSLGQRYKLVPHLDLAIAKAGEFSWDFHHTPKEVDDAWHPSGDCTPSLSELYLKASGNAEPEVIPVSLRKTFMVGHFYHQYIQWIIQHKLAFANADEIERRGMTIWATDAHNAPLPYHWATGSADIAPCHLPDGGRYLVDIKTMNAYDFRRTGPPQWAVDKWECQLAVYMEWFDLDEAIILGVHKDSPHDFKEFTFRRNPALVDAIFRKWRLVAACVVEGVEPPASEDILLPLTGAVQ